MLVKGKPGDQLPRALGTQLAAVAYALGYPADGDPGVFLDDYRRTARRARAVVERGCSTAGNRFPAPRGMASVRPCRPPPPC
jgi:hypothetical protein